MCQKGLLSKIQNAKYLRLFFGSNIFLLINNDHQFFNTEGQKRILIKVLSLEENEEH